MGLEALLYGCSPELTAPVPSLLSRAGFACDVITTSPKLQRCKNIRQLWVAPNDQDFASLVIKHAKKNYNFIAPTCDGALGLIRYSNASPEEKVRLLPILSLNNIDHIYSKTGLSRALARSNIRTPKFFVAEDRRQALDCFNSFDRAFFKINSSSGGMGVFRLQNETEFALVEQNLTYPLLVQEEVAGDQICLSGLFKEGRIVFFSYARMVDFELSGFGPSSVKQYASMASINKKVLDELNDLGAALGADGFCNITCIRSISDGEHYYIEADMRPNVWVEYPKFIGEDPAPRIFDYFSEGRFLSRDELSSSELEMDKIDWKTVSYLPRMTSEQVLANAYRCRDFFIDYFL